MQKSLFLILKKCWYQQISNGTKSIEYRSLNKFWCKRIIGKNFKHVVFQLGYSKNAPQMKVPITYIDKTKKLFQIHLDVKHIRHIIPLSTQDSLFDRQV